MSTAQSAAERAAELLKARNLLRYPTDRPRWLGEYQPWPCGRCGREVDNSESHACRPAVAQEVGR